MAQYVRIFVVENVERIHRDFLDAIRLARQVEQIRVKQGRGAGAVATRRELQRAYADFNRELDGIAKTTAVAARAAIRREIATTRTRPDTGNGPHLRDMIRARPIHPLGIIATGAVGVADIDVLDQLVNPQSPQYGPYWRSQEYGYKFRGKQLTGVVGGFYDRGFGGGPYRAESQFAGGSGPHPLFLPGRTGGAMAMAAGGTFRSGAGMSLVKFRSNLRPRGFIEKGASAAEVVWRRDLARLEAQVDARLAAITSPAAALRLGPRARRR